MAACDFLKRGCNAKEQRLFADVLATATSPRGQGCMLHQMPPSFIAGEAVTTTILDGVKIAAQIKTEVGEEVKELTAAGLRPGWLSFLRDIIRRRKLRSQQGKDLEQLGIYSEKHTPPETATTEELLTLIDDLNRRDEIDGILCAACRCQRKSTRRKCC